MSLFPYSIVREMLRPLRQIERQLMRDDFLYPSSFLRSSLPWADASPPTTNAEVTIDKEKFQVRMNVEQFSPEDITVKTINDNSILVEGKHEEKRDDLGYIARQFSRRYVIPQDHDVKHVQSYLSADGVLTITAPKKSSASANERVIPITQTGPAKIEDKSEGKAESGSNK